MQCCCLIYREERGACNTTEVVGRKDITGGLLTERQRFKHPKLRLRHVRFSIGKQAVHQDSRKGRGLLPAHCLQTTDEPQLPFISLQYILNLCCAICRKHRVCISLQRDNKGQGTGINPVKGDGKSVWMLFNILVGILLLNKVHIHFNHNFKSCYILKVHN